MRSPEAGVNPNQGRPRVSRGHKTLATLASLSVAVTGVSCSASSSIIGFPNNPNSEEMVAGDSVGLGAGKWVRGVNNRALGTSGILVGNSANGKTIGQTLVEDLVLFPNTKEVILMHGTNDISAEDPVTHARIYTVEDVVSTTVGLMNDLTAQGIRSTYYTEPSANYNKPLDDVGEGIAAILPDQTNTTCDDTVEGRDLFYDGVHLTTRGYQDLGWCIMQDQIMRDQVVFPPTE